MNSLTQLTPIISLGLGAAWASGLNLYATVLILGLAASNGFISLPPELMLVTDHRVLLVAGGLYVVEFFVDKIPGVDTGWDGLQTFIRVPAAGALAAGAVSAMNPGVMLVAALVGGILAAATHVAKAGVRVLVNTSPEPFSNWFVSLFEDLLVVGGLWTALAHPFAFLMLLVLFVLLLIWLLPRLWRGIRKIFTFLVGIFSPAPRDAAVALPVEKPLEISDQHSTRRIE